MTSAQPAADPQRTAGTLNEALGGMFEVVERPAVRVTAALVAGGYFGLGLLATGVPGLAWLGELPIWLPPALVTASAAVAAAVMPLAIVPRRVVAAWTALAYISASGHEQWQRVHHAPFPDASAADEWLRAHPGDGHALARAQVLIMHGRGTEATLPEESELAMLSSLFLRAQLAWLAAFTADDHGRERAARDRRADLAEQHQAGQDRAEARAILHMIDAFDARVDDREWLPILAVARQELGALARGTLARWFVLPRLRYYGRASLAVFVVSMLVTLAAVGLG